MMSTSRVPCRSSLARPPARGAASRASPASPREPRGLRHRPQGQQQQQGLGRVLLGTWSRSSTLKAGAGQHRRVAVTASAPGSGSEPKSGSDILLDGPTDGPTGVPAADGPAGASADIPADAPDGASNEVPAGASARGLADGPADGPADAPDDAPDNGPAGASAGSLTDAPAGGSPSVLAQLEEIQVTQASSGLVVDALSAIPAGGRVLVLFLTQFGDFDSWELSMKLSDKVPELEASGVKVVAFGIGSLPAARLFAVSTGFPLSKLYADPNGLAAQAMGFQPGAGRKGGAMPFLEGSLLDNGYLKLLLMCAGIGSPGTLREVIRGYTGDRSAAPVFQDGSAVDLEWKGVFDILGDGYQRPFELATFRLLNMGKILRDWSILSPKDSNMLVQRGGVLLAEDKGGSLLWRYSDPGILGYAPVSQIMERAIGSDPTAEDPLGTLHKAATQKTPYVSDVYDIITQLEQSSNSEEARGSDLLGGQWQMAYSSSSSGAGPGAYSSAVKTSLAFDCQSNTVRNCTSLGPIDVVLEGNFSFEGTELTLQYQSAQVKLKPLSESSGVAIPSSVLRRFVWSPGSQSSRRLSVIHVDSVCCATRAGDGGLALWSQLEGK